MSTLIVPPRFCGPPVSGNGGWTAGELAARLDPGRAGAHGLRWPSIRVRLSQPPPLAVELPVVSSDEGTTVVNEKGPVARAAIVDDVLEPVAPVPYAEALAAESTYAGLAAHPFPTCFACGPRREEGDGLRIFPGEVESVGGRRRVGATWTPHPSLAEDYHHYTGEERRASLATTWAALDCVGGWAEDLVNRPMVLGQMTARVDSLPLIGAPHVVVGQHVGSEGRKTFTASTLYGPDDTVVAVATHVWITVDPTAFG